MLRSIRVLLITVSWLLMVNAGIALAYEGGCVHNRTVYPEQSELCQSGTLMRCEEGAWAAIGFCEKEPGPEPISGGGDEELQPEQ